jgi:hypothetical protein
MGGEPLERRACRLGRLRDHAAVLLGHGTRDAPRVECPGARHAERALHELGARQRRIEVLDPLREQLGGRPQSVGQRLRQLGFGP